MLTNLAQQLFTICKEYLENRIDFYTFKNNFENVYFGHSKTLSELELDVFEMIYSDSEYCEPNAALRDHPSYTDESEFKRSIIENLDKLYNKDL